MSKLFAETLRRLRTDRGLSQRGLARAMYVTQSTVARWENGSRLPDAAMMSRLAERLGVDVGALMSAAAESGGSPNVIMVEDSTHAVRERPPRRVVRRRRPVHGRGAEGGSLV